MAFEFNTLVVYANVSGDAAIQLKSKPWKSFGTGQSQICVPLLGRVAQLADPKKEGHVFYRYDKSFAKVAEHITDLRKDIKQGGFLTSPNTSNLTHHTNIVLTLLAAQSNRPYLPSLFCLSFAIFERHE